MAGRPRTHIPLDVILNGRLVGQLRRAGNGATSFRYAEAWLDRENAIPVSLSLPLRESPYTGDPVVAVFDNLLPDNNEIRQRLAARTRARGNDAFSLLGAIGRDCIGGLRFSPEGNEPDLSPDIVADPVSEADIAAILGNLGKSPLGVTADETFRICLAGAQEKTALLWWNDKWHIPHGPTPTTHILKPTIGKLPNGMDLSDSVDNEHLCAHLANAVGLPCAKTEIATFGGIRTLVVERFDRFWARDGRLMRRPQEDGCQALGIPSALKYESDGGPGISRMLELLRASDEPELDRHTFLKAQMFFWLLGATDGHAKNFSIHLLPGGRFRLAPLYDILSTQSLVDSAQIRQSEFRLSMAVGNNRHYIVGEIQPQHFEQTALASGIAPEINRRILRELAEALPRALDEVSRSLPSDFSQRQLEHMGAGVRHRLRIAIAES